VSQLERHALEPKAAPPLGFPAEPGMERGDRSRDALSVVYVENDVRVARVTAKYLESHGLVVTLASGAGEGVAAVMRVRPDAVLLDFALPGIDGIEVCRQLRARTDVPIVTVTARNDEADRVALLEEGADDCVVKPFSSRELLARIRAHVRRAEGRVGPRAHSVRVGGLVLDAAAMSVALHGEAIAVTTYEFVLLHALAVRAGHAMKREQLVGLVRGTSDETFDRTIDVHISHLRQKLHDDPRKPRLLKTVRGVGYMLAMQRQ
jgi:two-component system OmpR family response regulator